MLAVPQARYTPFFKICILIGIVHSFVLYIISASIIPLFLSYPFLHLLLFIVSLVVLVLAFLPIHFFNHLVFGIFSSFF